jgi:cell wall-associated NlpC family hydrolase
MRSHDHVLPKAIGTLLAATTLFGAMPKPASADPVRATSAEAADGKAPKKTKRKRSATTPGLKSWHGWSHGMSWVRFDRPTPAEIAVATARAQLGKRYRWGAVGPSAFDCSGLTRFAWGAAGVGLPHSSRAQYASYHRVPLGKLEPGDIVYSPGHVGIYIGKGRMIHAPQTGQRVQISPLHRNALGGVRPAA